MSAHSFANGTISSSGFAVGATAFAKQWNDSNQTPVARWVPETDETKRNRVADGYLAFEGVCIDGDEVEDDKIDEVGDVSEDVSDDEASLPPVSKNSNKILLEYHVVYSASYRTPLLLVRGQQTLPPKRTLRFSDLDTILWNVSTGIGLEESNVVNDGSPTVTSSLFAPMDHPHSGFHGGSQHTQGCFVGAHPCETKHVMRLLLENDDGESESDSKKNDEQYFAAWFGFASRAVPGLGTAL